MTATCNISLAHTVINKMHKTVLRACRQGYSYHSCISNCLSRSILYLLNFSAKMKVTPCILLALVCVFGIATAQYNGYYYPYYNYGQNSGGGGGSGRKYMYIDTLLLSCQPRMTVMSRFVNNANRDL